MSEASKDYEVGFGRPPKATQFKSGKSGNPAGRPKGSKNLPTLLALELEKKVDVIVQGQPRRLSKGEVMVIKQVDRAISGNDRAFATVVKLSGTGFGVVSEADDARPGSTPVPDKDYSALMAEMVARRAREDRDDRDPD